MSIPYYTLAVFCLYMLSTLPASHINYPLLCIVHPFYILSIPLYILSVPPFYIVSIPNPSILSPLKYCLYMGR